MTRENAIEEVKSRYAEILRPAKKKGYICPRPECGSGSGPNGTGITENPKRPGQLSCWACGFKGDVIDLYMEEYNCSFNDALNDLCDRLNIRIDAEAPTRPVERREAQNVKSHQDTTENATQASTEGSLSEEKDFTAYYKTCWQHRGDPAAVEYLRLRGISQDLAEALAIGYDPAGYVIIPCTQSAYVARATDPNAELRYKNAKDVKMDLFNKSALYGIAGKPIFIVEGAFDALAVMEAGCEAVSLNGTGNANKLIEWIKKNKDENHRSPSGTVIICLDNDKTGQKAAANLLEGLQALDVPTTVANICGNHKDPNEALTSDRAAFIEAVKALQYPGLLTTTRAIATLEAVDDHYLELPHFPQLASTIKLRTHDTVVIAADTGAGKSSLSLNLLHDLQDKYPAVYVNLEMDEATVLQRLISIHTGIELDRIEGYKHDANTRAEVNAAIKEITARKEIQLIEDIYDLKQLEAAIKAATAGRTEPTIVFIDTGLLVTLPNKSASRYERFTQISEELRRISRLNNVVMFVLLQQNREGKREDQKAPTNSSLKESGSWENDATKIMFLWKNPNTNNKEILITKNRNGKTGSVELTYSPLTQTFKERSGTFTDLDDDSDEPPAVFMRI